MNRHDIPSTDHGADAVHGAGQPGPDMGDNAIPDGVSIEALMSAPFSMVLSDPTKPGNPIIFVNTAFERTTGYAARDAVGRNCRFLQGPDTNQGTVDRMRDALRHSRDVTVDILNYRRNGERFWNRLYLAPLQVQRDGVLVPYYLGIQTDLGAEPEAYSQLVQSERALIEVRHRVKNHLAMIVGMIRLQARQSTASEDFVAVARRVEALQLLYEELSSLDERLGNANHDRIDLRTYAERIASALARLTAGTRIDIAITGERISASLGDATQIGLALSEIVTNAIQHGFDGRTTGRVTIDIRRDTPGTQAQDVLVTISDDGAGFPAESDWPSTRSLGGRIVTQLVSALDGAISIGARPDGGTIVQMRLPAAHYTGTGALIDADRT